jgi:hypothetical protein
VPEALMAFDRKKFIADPRACILPKGAAFGDRRYRYKNYWCLAPMEKQRLRESGAYPYNTPGIPPEAYAYPIDAKGRLVHGQARRALIWSRQHIISRRAGKGLLGRARRRRR